MKKLYAIFVLITLSVTALAQSGRDLYNKYSDLPGMEAVYISPAMFRLIGKIPDIEFQDDKIDFSPIIKSMTGFYILNTEDSQLAVSLLDEVKRFIQTGKYELLMEAKESGELVRMYTTGDDVAITSFVMVSQEGQGVSFLSFDGKMDRNQMENILAQAASSE